MALFLEREFRPLSSAQLYTVSCWIWENLRWRGNGRSKAASKSRYRHSQFRRKHADSKMAASTNSSVLPRSRRPVFQWKTKPVVA